MGLGSSIPIEHSPVVETKYGPVRGKVFTFDNKKYDAFLGIPYAEPPIGKLRFKKPEPVSPWKETRDCVAFGPRCPQHDDIFSRFMNIVGTDEADCLTVNVIAPREKSEEWKSGYPVMVWIHGGGFVVHSSSNYGDSTAARNLCSKDVIFVSINYRLGAFGFFTTGTDECPGNFGMWDQTLALRWVQENIEAFGGNPKNVTIFGQSAGGASVDLLSLSPHSRDLFNRAIPMAGTAECAFALRTQRDQASISRQFARKVGWKGDDEDVDGLLEFMHNQPTDKLCVQLIGDQFHFKESGNLPFVPVLDGDFMPATVAELRKQMPKKEVLTGTTEHEGISLSFMGNFHCTKVGIEHFVDMTIKEADFGGDYHKIHEEVKEFYLRDAGDKHHVTRKAVDLVGDHIIYNGTVRYVEEMTKLGHDVYFYNFPYYNPDGFGIFRWILPFRAATHCTELRYVLGKGILTKFKPNEDDLKMVEKMTTYFTNFAKYGNPNGKELEGPWHKHSSSDAPRKHLRIDLPECSMQDVYQENRSKFWYDKVMPKHGSWLEVNGAKF